MNLLAIETSSPVLSVAIKKSGGKLRHAMVKGYMRHAENLLPVIDRLLKKEKLRVRDIDAFLIDRGPGSFTGLRIGFATLKGLLAIRPKPCYGAFSLDVIAAGIPSPSTLLTPGVGATPASDTRCRKGGNLTVCLDARRGKLYARSYQHKKKNWSAKGPARVLSFEEMLQNTPGKSLIAGDGLPKIETRDFEVLPEKKWHPRAATLIELFEGGSPFIKKLTRPRDLLPAYLRSSEPEEKLFDARKRIA